jgi:hypothetical protein
MAKRLSRVWIATAVLLLLLATSDIIPRRSARITDLFFRYQDLPILIAITIAAAALLILASSGPRTAARLGRIISNVPTAWVAKVARPAIPTALAVFTAAIAYAGSKLVFDNYPLSMDEFLATFDATILGRGQTMAPIAQQWRAYAPALQPMFMLPMPGHAFWVSGYLPVNAILRA